MPEIDRQLFKGKDQLLVEDWQKVSAPDLSPKSVGEVLFKCSWSGKAATTVGVQLTADNTTAEGAKLLLAGSWGSGLKLQAKRLFSAQTKIQY